MAIGFSYLKLNAQDLVVGIVSGYGAKVDDPTLIPLDYNGNVVNPNTNDSVEPIIGHTFNRDTYSFEPPHSIDEEKAFVVERIKAESGDIIAANQFRIDRYKQQRSLMKVGLLDSTDEKSWLIKSFIQSIRQQSNDFEAQLNALTELDDVLAFNWTFDTNPTLSAPVFRVITKRAFINRIPPAAYAAMQSSDRAEMIKLNALLNTAEYIELDLQETKDAANALVLFQFIDDAEKAELLKMGEEHEIPEEDF